MGASPVAVLDSIRGLEACGDVNARDRSRCTAYREPRRELLTYGFNCNLRGVPCETGTAVTIKDNWICD